MNMLKGLYFPGTSPDKEQLACLFHLLDKVDYYRVVEDEQDTAGASDPSPGSWEARTVMPLGEDRARFLAMIRDIKTHAAEFYEGCLSAMLADAQNDRDESSVWRLVTSLHGKGPGAGWNRLVEEKLWQARLVLKLAEILDEQQAELDKGLELLRLKEQEVFASLKGDIDGDDDEAGIFHTGASEFAQKAGGGSMRRRLTAWSVLFALDTLEYGLLVTDSEEASSMVFAAWEELTAAPPRVLAEIELPGPGVDIEKGREERAVARGAISTALGDILSGEQERGIAALDTAAKSWNESRTEGGGRMAITIHLLTGYPFRRLWDRIGRLPGRPQAGSETGLVAVLRPVSGTAA